MNRRFDHFSAAMNIFLLSRSARRAARYHSNKHVIKMILETAQLLCTAHSVLDHDGKQVPVDKLGVVKTYRPTHRNHPWAIAVRRDERLYRWAALLGLFLCKEYSRRYPGKRHASQTLLERLQRVPPFAFSKSTFVPEPFQPQTKCLLVELKMEEMVFETKVPLAMPLEHAVEDAVGSYRKYYHTKDAIHKWPADPPAWYKAR